MCQDSTRNQRLVKKIWRIFHYDNEEKSHKFHLFKHGENQDKSVALSTCKQKKYYIVAHAFYSFPIFP